MCTIFNITNANDDSAWSEIITASVKESLKQAFMDIKSMIPHLIISHYIECFEADTFSQCYYNLLQREDSDNSANNNVINVENTDVTITTGDNIANNDVDPNANSTCCFKSLIISIWDNLCNNWFNKVNDSSFMSWYMGYILRDFKNDEHFANGQKLFDDCVDKTNEIDYYAFIYTCVNEIKAFLFWKIKNELIDITLKKLKYKDENLNEYTVFSFGGAVINSLLRIYYGHTGNTINKQLKIAIVRKLMLSYNKTDSEKKEYSQIPKRLMIENIGGMRIITRACFNFIQPLIKCLQKELPNIILKRGNQLKSVLKQLQTDSNGAKFTKLFNISDFDDIWNRHQNDKSQSKAYDQNWQKIVDANINTVFEALTRSLASKCIYGSIKEKQQKLDKTSLRQKLSLHHNMTHTPKTPV